MEEMEFIQLSDYMRSIPTIGNPNKFKSYPPSKKRGIP